MHYLKTCQIKRKREGEKKRFSTSEKNHRSKQSSRLSCFAVDENMGVGSGGREGLWSPPNILPSNFSQKKVVFLVSDCVK